MSTSHALAAVLGLWFAMLALGAAPAAATSRGDPLGAAGVSLASAFQPGGPVPAAAVSKKWRRVLSGVEDGRASCPASEKACDDWHALKAQLAGTRDRLTLLEKVNDAVNRLAYFADARLWGLNDYWATPAEFLARGAGDCEDYAIAKYFLLLELGVPAEAMRIAIVRDIARRLIHAVLVVQTARGPMLLDNVIEEVVPAVRAPQYRALLALNQESMSVYIIAAGSSAAGR